MDIALDYRDLLKILNQEKVKYLIVGAYAVMFYTEPRYSKDIDIWVKPDIDNAKRVYKALAKFGAPLKGMSVEDFTKEAMVYQIGLSPVRIDIIMGIKGLDFDYAWQRRTMSKYADIAINIIGLAELKEAKLASKRPQDLLDVERLNKRKDK